MVVRRTWKERRLIMALRGTDGYAVQQAAWDAVFPDWRRPQQLVIKGTRAPRREWEELRGIWERANLRENHPIAWRCWHTFTMQAMYLSCPALGGWFPD